MGTNVGKLNAIVSVSDVSYLSALSALVDSLLATGWNVYATSRTQELLMERGIKVCGVDHTRKVGFPILNQNGEWLPLEVFAGLTVPDTGANRSALDDPHNNKGVLFFDLVCCLSPGACGGFECAERRADQSVVDWSSLWTAAENGRIVVVDPIDVSLVIRLLNDGELTPSQRQMIRMRLAEKVLEWLSDHVEARFASLQTARETFEQANSSS